ncbi:hypothetical protein N7478_004359 [Penicillium angulare]|uniref:uncharacterized protein n=1 Tax=Penicillium angulare TaxID=116970 RepID=UPI00254006F9|nr:uncharacterized protein N7478_004359 [Penicillium angulare]KAJ5278987.1 hypothetical protein N7478_004359 [Penicillium angulare]
MPPPNSATHGTPALSPTTPAPESLSRRVSSSDLPVLIDETDNAHDENVNFLRSRSLLYNPLLPSLSRHRRRNYATSPSDPIEDEEDRMDLDDPSNLRLSVEINRRIPIVRRQREEPNPTNMPTYDGRRLTSRTFYGWAPGSDDEDEAHHRGEESDDDQIQPFLHAVSDRNTSSSRPRRHESTTHSVAMDVGDRHQSSEGVNRSQRSSSPISTMEALLQTARRQPRLARTRTLENYLLDRWNRPIDEPEETERPTGGSGSSSSRAYRYRPTNRNESHRMLTHSDLRARATAHRQIHSGAAGDSLLKDTINYLDRLRYSNSVQESINSAHAKGFLSTENFSSDFILDTYTIAPPPPCSWLRPGVIFSGCQRAANASSSVLPQRIPSPHAPSEPVIVNGNDGHSNPRISVYTTSGRRYMANNTRDENWPVKVTIHNIDYDEMTLSGTMEAYNIPDKTSQTHDAHIVTFLEGEIIDFNNHTLETKNFKADADIDSTYWRELPPFKDLSDAEIARNLVSRKWITEELAKGWILMRWKGKFHAMRLLSFSPYSRCTNFY